jgi:hypothetical protein
MPGSCFSQLIWHPLGGEELVLLTTKWERSESQHNHWRAPKDKNVSWTKQNQKDLHG